MGTTSLHIQARIGATRASRPKPHFSQPMSRFLGYTSGRRRGKPSTASIALRASLTWFGLLVLAFVNAAFRELVMVRSLDVTPQVGQQLSALTAIILFTGLVWVAWPWMGVQTSAGSFMVGAAWCVATALFEGLVLNMWLGGLSFTDVLDTYDLSKGRLWPLVLSWISMLPSMVLATHPGA